MFSGKTIEQLIATVERAEQDARVQRIKVPARVMRYEANPGFIYAVHFGETARIAGVA